MSRIQSKKEMYESVRINENVVAFDEHFYNINGKIFRFVIYKSYDDKIEIKCKNYGIKMDCFELSNATKSLFNTSDEAFDYLNNLFEENKVNLNSITPKKEIKLILNIYIYNKEKPYELILKYNKYSFDEPNNNYNELKNEINNLKEEIDIIKNENRNFKNEFQNLKNKNEILRIEKEINYLKEEEKLIKDEIKNIQQNIENIKKEIENEKVKNDYNKNNFEKNPIDIKFREDINDAYAKYVLENSFSSFKSIDEIYYLIYSNKNKDILFYDLEKNKIIKERKNAHNEYISGFRHYLENNIYNKRDIIMSVSCKDNNIKLWNVQNLDLLLNLQNINLHGELDSACFLKDKNQSYIISSNDEENELNTELIKVYDFNGNKIKEIFDSNDNTFFIDSFFDKKLNKNFIITSNNSHMKSYDFNENKLYQTYCNFDNRGHFSFIIYEKNNMIKLIDSVVDGNIKIWNFHTARLLKKIKIANYRIYSICLWNYENLFIGSEDKTIKLIELNNGTIIKIIEGHNKDVISLRKIYIPQYGECLISQGWLNEKIKLYSA